MFAEKNDEIIKNTNDQAEAKLEKQPEESNIKALAGMVLDSVGFAAGFISAVAGTCLVIDIVGLSLMNTSLIFLFISVLFMGVGFIGKQKGWFPAII